MHTFLFVLLGSGIFAVTLPLVLELAVLTAAFLLVRGQRQATSAAANLGLAIVVPAHNEELLIGRTIESLRASDAASRKTLPARILVIAHNCSDQTAEQAARAGAEVLVYDDPEARGKGFALRHGFDRVFSDGAGAALVVDADSTVSVNLVGKVYDALSAGSEVVQCRYEMTCPGKSAKGQLAALAFRGFNLVRPAGRAKIGFSAGILGNGFAISKEVFSAVPYQALSLVEDLEYHIHLVVAGKRVEFLQEAQVSSGLPTSKAGHATQRSRWEGGRFHAARHWLGPLAERIMRGQLRVTEPFLDLAGLPLAYGAAFLFVALLLPLPWLRVYAAVAFGVIAIHVLTAAWAGENFWGDLRVLGMAPAYVFWKLRLVPHLLRGSSSRSTWVRTERAPAVREL
jgi:cellulose synthase/poly-beta-1,6-N-acetylglucosamine synthase-like glycosyltransferase